MAKKNLDSKVTLSAKQYILNDEPVVIDNEIKERIDIGTGMLAGFRQLPKAEMTLPLLIGHCELEFSRFY
jgi:hypothetical protein